MKVGPLLHKNGTCDFVVWAPFFESVELNLLSHPDTYLPMHKDHSGYWRLLGQPVSANALYRFRLNGEMLRADPASHFQPQGVHGPSELVDHAGFSWDDQQWSGIPLSDYILYEIHTGTFTSEGTFEAILGKLPHLRSLGVTALEIMPIAQFPGTRNWGYDGAYSYAVQNSYGGPYGFKNLVKECHRQGFSVVLDVVYNHFGPEGAYVTNFGPYFTKNYTTPWGDAINFDEAHSDPVREYFIENALFWLEEYHVDAMRLDAIHGICDRGAHHFLKELSERVEELSQRTGRKRYLIAESDLNDARVIRPRESGGHGIDAQWSDDWHHSIIALLTRERQGYYSDFGTVEHLKKAFMQSFVYAWDFSEFRRRHHGCNCDDRHGEQFVICTQNHDQVGNRAKGERLSVLADFEAQKLAAGALLIAPYIPLLFMGQEYGEKRPFPYFVSHSDEQLIQAVREGRKREFYDTHYQGEVPDPQAVETFQSAILDWESVDAGEYRVLFELYRELISLRKNLPGLRSLDRTKVHARVASGTETLLLSRGTGNQYVTAFMNFGESTATIQACDLPVSMVKVLDTRDKRWGGPGDVVSDAIQPGHTLELPGHCFVLYRAAP